MRRSELEQAAFDAFEGFVRQLRSVGAGRRQDAIDALLLTFHEEVFERGQIAAALADRVLCLLDVSPMSPLEMGRILGVDSESAVFKNALTGLRASGLVEADGPKHERIYRAVRQ